MADVAITYFPAHPVPGEVPAALREWAFNVVTVPWKNFPGAAAISSLVLAWLPPGQSTLFRQVVERSRLHAPQIFILGVSPQGQPEESELALLAGFDDFVAGRSSVRELVARLRSLQRRVGRRSAKPAVRSSAIIDDASHSLILDNSRVVLTVSELVVARMLLATPGAVCTREQLRLAIWGKRAITPGCERGIDQVILRLRRKLPRTHKIETVRGVGFRLGFSL